MNRDSQKNNLTQSRRDHGDEFRWDRRAFLLGTGACVAAVAAPGLLMGESAKSSEDLIDVNVTLSRWPTRRLPLDETPKLVKKLRENGVTQAWAGTFDGLLHKDMQSANTRLAENCAQSGDGVLLPFGSVNPKLPDWEEDLRQCAEEHKMPGVRLHPNYHGYKLDDPDFARLMLLAAEHGLIVQIALHMEDERMMHPLMRAEPVDVASLSELLLRVKGARVVLLNALNLLVGEQLTRALAAGDVSVEIATLEGAGGLDRLLSTVPLSRVLFGSHAPLFYFESAQLKLRESALDAAQLKAIRFENAKELLHLKGTRT